jgi:hypothetical protein
MVKITLLGDIAGQISAKSLNADKVTVGCICVPSGALSFIREQIPANFPKWRNAEDSNIDFVVNLLLRESMSICAASLDKTTQEWIEFWEDASEVHIKTASLAGGSISFIKAANLIKFMQFSEAATLAFAHALKIGTIPKIMDHKKRLHVHEEIIVDNDIQGSENIDAFVDILRASNSHQPLMNSLGVVRTITSLRVTTEDIEPLLLLPDYIAGIFHAANSKANTISQSKLTKAEVERAYSRLTKAQKFHEPNGNIRLKFFEIFPDFAIYSGKHTT